MADAVFSLFSSVIAQLDFDVSSVERLGNPEKRNGLSGQEAVSQW